MVTASRQAARGIGAENEPSADDSDNVPTRPRITVREVAQAAGVSPMTVSRVLNRVPGAGLATRERVLREADRLGYRPNGLAKALRERSSRTVAILVPDITNPFFPEIIRGAEDHAEAEGYSLLLCNVGEDPKREAALLGLLESKRVDGVIVCSPRLGDARLAELVARHEAAVLVNRALSPEIAGLVSIDYAAGAAMAVAHLADACGCRRIGILAGPASSRGGAERLAGAREALGSRGLSPAWMAHCAPDVDGARLAVERAGPRVGQLDGLLCYNDLNAIGAIQAMRAGGLAALPAIIGFDDIMLAALVSPALTSVRVDKYELGRAAMRMLLERRAGLGLSAAISVRPNLVVRESARPRG